MGALLLAESVEGLAAATLLILHATLTHRTEVGSYAYFTFIFHFFLFNL